MTLREAWSWFTSYWTDYYYTVTTENFLDWELSYLAWTVYFAIMALCLMIYIVLSPIVTRIEKSEQGKNDEWMKRNKKKN